MYSKRPINKNGYEIIVFDCDSTLSKIEGADELAKYKGLDAQVAEITDLGMDGKIPFEESLAKRLDILRPNKEEVKWLAYRYLETVSLGVRDVLVNLRNEGKELFLISGGYTQAVSLFAEHLGFGKDNIFAIDLYFDEEGNFSAYDKGNPLTFAGGKAVVLKDVSKKGRTLLVGDGSTDLEAYYACDLFVGYGGIVERGIVKNNCDVYLEKEDLTPIIDIARGIDPFYKVKLGSSLSRPGTINFTRA